MALFGSPARAENSIPTAGSRWKCGFKRTGWILVFAASSCQSPQQHTPPATPHPRQEIVDALKSYEQTLGFDETKNFSKHSADAHADYRCYYTRKLRLPDSYDGLRVTDGDEGGCGLDENKYDVFFYPIEAVASGKTPMTSSLAEASLERFAVVVPHEDFHHQKQIRKWPAPIKEAAATLVAFLTAAEFANQQFGAASETYRNLSREAELFLQKAEIVNAYHEKLSRVYAAARKKEITRQQALNQKQKLFSELEDLCLAIHPRPHSFNSCPAAVNNAGLAFDRTYTKHYALLYQLYLAQGRDVKNTVATLQRPPAVPPSEKRLVSYFRGLIEQYRRD